MAILNKELLQRLENSIFKETAIKKDARSIYFYLSFVNAAPGTPLGTQTNIDVAHIRDELGTKDNQMIVLSIADSFISQSPGQEFRPIYIRFQGLEVATRYQFAVAPGVNSFNTSNNITIPCSSFPRDTLSCEFGLANWDNRVEEQQEQSVLGDISGIEIIQLNVRFKIQTITLD